MVVDAQGPTAVPSLEPSALPSLEPSALPTLEPTSIPTLIPTSEPSSMPSSFPTLLPTLAPSALPSIAPTSLPTLPPTALPTIHPTATPTLEPSAAPTSLPTLEPSLKPTALPSVGPTATPTLTPSLEPSRAPSLEPSPAPTFEPSLEPTALPTPEPTALPTLEPTLEPTALPTIEPTRLPTIEPTALPTLLPTLTPTSLPSLSPTNLPTAPPTLWPTPGPTIVPTLLPTAVPTPAPLRRLQRGRRQRRRRLLSSTAAQLDDAILSMNSAIGQGLVAGEASDVTSKNLGMRTSKVDPTLLATSGDSNGFTIGAATSSSSGLPSSVEPSMVLPPTMNLSGDVTVAAVNYGKANPYEALGGAIAEGSSVNAFTFNGIEVSGLADPIVLALPLPSSRRRLLEEQRRQQRRRLGTDWNGTWGSKDFAQSYSVNCGGTNVTKLEATYTSEDLARAQHCGTEHLLENMTEWVKYKMPWVNNSKKVWCNSTQDWHFLDCEGTIGVINFTCPVWYPVSTCTYWDTSKLAWSSEGCTYWRTDEVNGVAYCNCTHLTAFASSQADEQLSSVQTFLDTTASAEDLSGKDVVRNIGVLVTLVMLWVCAGVLYSYDSTKRRF